MGGRHPQTPAGMLTGHSMQDCAAVVLAGWSVQRSACPGPRPCLFSWSLNQQSRYNPETENLLLSFMQLNLFRSKSSDNISFTHSACPLLSLCSFSALSTRGRGQLVRFSLQQFLYTPRSLPNMYNTEKRKCFRSCSVGILGPPFRA